MVGTLDRRRDQFLLFSRFAHLYDAGVPLAEALDLVRVELSRDLRQVVGEVIDDVYRGTSLAAALARRRDVFAPGTVGVIRVGEERGELGAAARNVAAGLEGQVLDVAAVPQSELDKALEGAGDVLHVPPGDPLATALSRAADLHGTGRGAFLWRDHLVRVAIAATHVGAAAVARLSPPPGEPPAEAAAWQKGPPKLLLVAGDAELRAVLASHPGRRIAVNLPAPEAPSVDRVEVALWLEPEVVGVADLRPQDAVLLAGVHAVAWTEDADAVRKAMGAAKLPPPEIAVS